MPTTGDPGGSTATLPDVDEATGHDHPWQVILWNDPVNTTDYVTMTLVRVLKVGAAEAERLMLLAHTEGRAAVANGTQAHCKDVTCALMAAQLWATMEKVTP